MLGIITAVNTERDAILAKMINVHSAKIYDIDLYTGTISETPCILALSGPGKVNAARCTQLIIDIYQPKKIINLGSAGALHEELEIGDIVISNSCVQHDVDLTAFGHKKCCFSDQDSGFINADPEFVELCNEVIISSANKNFNIFVQPIATGDQFYNIPEKKISLHRQLGAYCVDMEGAAVAQVCSSCSIPFVIIRSISDKLVHLSENVYYDYNKLASQRCATFLEELIKRIEDKSK